MIIERAFNKLFVMIPILVFLAVSCSNMMNPHSGVSRVPVSTPSIKVITQTIVKHDTIIVFKKLQTDDADFRIRVEKLISEQNARQSARFDTSDNRLKELIVLLTQQNLYVSTRARMYRVQNDSLWQATIKSQKETREEVVNGFKKLNDAQKINKSTFSMYDILGTTCFILILLTYFLKGLEWLNRKFRKSPAL